MIGVWPSSARWAGELEPVGGFEKPEASPIGPREGARARHPGPHRIAGSRPRLMSPRVV